MARRPPTYPQESSPLIFLNILPRTTSSVFPRAKEKLADFSTFHAEHPVHSWRPLIWIDKILIYIYCPSWEAYFTSFFFFFFFLYFFKSTHLSLYPHWMLMMIFRLASVNFYFISSPNSPSVGVSSSFALHWQRWLIGIFLISGSRSLTDWMVNPATTLLLLLPTTCYWTKMPRLFHSLSPAWLRRGTTTVRKEKGRSSLSPENRAGECSVYPPATASTLEADNSSSSASSRSVQVQRRSAAVQPLGRRGCWVPVDPVLQIQCVQRRVTRGLPVLD